MHCGQSGYLAWNCPKQSQKPLPNVKAQAMWVGESPEISEPPKKTLVDILFLGELST